MGKYQYFECSNNARGNVESSELVPCTFSLIDRVSPRSILRLLRVVGSSDSAAEQRSNSCTPMANDDWDGAASMHKALKVLATSSRPISASRVKTAAARALDNVKVCL